MTNRLFESISVVLGELDTDDAPEGVTISIANVCFGAGPGGGDYRNYLLEKNNELEWTLWFSIANLWADVVYIDEEADDENGEPKLLYALQATAKTNDLVSPEVVATELLKATWIEEKEERNTNFDEFTVDDPGLLSKEQIETIINATPSNTADYLIIKLIEAFSKGEDVSEIVARIEAANDEFHDWVLSRVLINNFCFMVSVENIPIPSDEKYTEYFDEDYLLISSNEKKLETIKSFDLDESNTLHYENIGDVCISVEGQTNGQNGVSFHNIRIFSNFSTLLTSHKEQGILLTYGEEILNYSDSELIDIWDNFVKRCMGGLNK